MPSPHREWRTLLTLLRSARENPVLMASAPSRLGSLARAFSFGQLLAGPVAAIVAVAAGWLAYQASGNPDEWSAMAIAGMGVTLLCCMVMPLLAHQFLRSPWLGEGRLEQLALTPIPRREVALGVVFWPVVAGAGIPLCVGAGATACWFLWAAQIDPEVLKTHVTLPGAMFVRVPDGGRLAHVHAAAQGLQVLAMIACSMAVSAWSVLLFHTLLRAAVPILLAPMFFLGLSVALAEPVQALVHLLEFPAHRTALQQGAVSAAHVLVALATARASLRHAGVHLFRCVEPEAFRQHSPITTLMEFFTNDKKKDQAQLAELKRGFPRRWLQSVLLAGFLMAIHMALKPTDSHFVWEFGDGVRLLALGMAGAVAGVALEMRRKRTRVVPMLVHAPIECVFRMVNTTLVLVLFEICWHIVAPLIAHDWPLRFALSYAKDGVVAGALVFATAWLGLSAVATMRAGQRAALLACVLVPAAAVCAYEMGYEAGSPVVVRAIPLIATAAMILGTFKSMAVVSRLHSWSREREPV